MVGIKTQKSVLEEHSTYIYMYIIHAIRMGPRNLLCHWEIFRVHTVLPLLVRASVRSSIFRGTCMQIYMYAKNKVGWCWEIVHTLVACRAIAGMYSNRTITAQDIFLIGCPNHNILICYLNKAIYMYRKWCRIYLYLNVLWLFLRHTPRSSSLNEFVRNTRSTYKHS